MSIISIESYDNEIHRVLLDNGIMLDIPEKKECIQINEVFNYEISTKELDYKNFTTIMNGKVYHIDDNFCFVSFGGFLCRIPKNLSKYNMDDEISLGYKL